MGVQVPKQLRGFTTVTIHVYPRQNLNAQRARSVWSSRNAAEDEHEVSLGLWPHAEPSCSGKRPASRTSAGAANRLEST